MKKIMIAVLAALILSGCGSSPPNATPGAKKIISAKGRVRRIERGRDGYAAQIKNAAGDAYLAVVSSVDLAGSGRYREVKVGDEVAVEGEDASGDGRTIKVTAFR